MTDAEILDGLRSVARAHLGFDGPLTSDTPLVEALRLDSVRLLTLVVELENHFQVCFDPEDEAGLETAADIVRLVRKRLP